MLFDALHPLGYYGSLSAAMAACMYMFVTTERKLQRAKNSLERQIAETGRETNLAGAQIASLDTRLGELAERTKEMEDRVAGLAAVRRPQVATTGVDANQRSQVMRMARRGDRPEQISAELRVPKSEVDLLLKVQRAVVRAY